MRYINDSAIIERVSILDDYQGQGFGKYIMKTILFDLKQSGVIAYAKLSSQTYAIPFYEKLGYTKIGEPFFIADIGIHHIMKKKLANAYE